MSSMILGTFQPLDSFSEDLVLPDSLGVGALVGSLVGELVGGSVSCLFSSSNWSSWPRRAFTLDRKVLSVTAGAADGASLGNDVGEPVGFPVGDVDGSRAGV